jgi:hypothetical protein
LSVAEAVLRYLAVDHALAAPAAYRAVLDQVRAVARRRGDSRWRLIGLELQGQQVDADCSTPSLDEWAEAEGLGDWSADELQLLYAERFASADAGGRRRQARNARLREKRLQLLRELEAAAAVPAALADLVEGWLPGEISEVLRRGGVLTLGDLRERIAVGGRWWRGLPAVGPTKAGRLSQLLDTLLGPAGQGSRTSGWPLALAPSELARLSGAQGSNRLALPASSAGIEAVDDRQAVRAWVAARAGSPLTATQYEREAERFLLWCVLERGKALSDATAEDCRGYMDFIADVPLRWISRRRVARLTPGWAPFAGPLSVASQQLAITVVASLFGWLVQARYLASNPWVLVNRRLGDDAHLDIEDAGSRAFTPATWSALISHLDRASPSSSVARLRWICTFVQATGLRAAELLRAQRGTWSNDPLGGSSRSMGRADATGWCLSRGSRLKPPAPTSRAVGLISTRPAARCRCWRRFRTGVLPSPTRPCIRRSPSSSRVPCARAVCQRASVNMRCRRRRTGCGTPTPRERPNERYHRTSCRKTWARPIPGPRLVTIEPSSNAGNGLSSEPSPKAGHERSSTGSTNAC